jgi:hypothetical protein
MDTTLANTSTVVASEHQTSSQVGDEQVILDLEGGVYYGLNDVGARIWEIVQEPVQVEEIIATIQSEYDVTEKQCAADVKELLAEMEEYGLVRITVNGS